MASLFVCDSQGAQIVQLISDYREMLAKRRQTSSTTTVTGDDADSVSLARRRHQQQHSPPAAGGSRHRPRPTTYRPGVSGPAAPVPASSRRRPGGGGVGHRRPQSPPTSSPELPDAPSQPSATTTSAPVGVHDAPPGPGKTTAAVEFKYKRVKDSVRQPQKRGHLQLAGGRKSDARQEGIFD